MTICWLERLRIKDLPSLQGWKPQQFQCAAEGGREESWRTTSLQWTAEEDSEVSGGPQQTQHHEVDALAWRQ